MRTIFSNIALTVSFLLAITFTFSCSGGDDNEGDNGGGNFEYGSLSYQGKTYKTIKIGNQTWMAENLNYNVIGSKCYDESEVNCNEYGRLYNWKTAMSVCPSDWHLSSNADWESLISYVESNSGCSNCAGKHLRGTNGWLLPVFTPDNYGFTALPGGEGKSNGGFIGIGFDGNWWTSTESGINYAYCRNISINHDAVYSMAHVDVVDGNDEGIDKTNFYSVRCVKD